jgi:exodeoxyribonuclease V
MVGCKIVQDILNTGAIIIAFGDPGQLGPINEPQYFTKADHELTQIHRQALDSPIIRQAHRVRQGLPYEPDTENFRVVRRLYDRDILGADILLCWTNAKRRSLNAQKRALLGIRSTSPQAGEPLMCLRNSRKYGVYKGALYPLIEPITDSSTSIIIDVDGVIKTIGKTKFDVTEQSRDDDRLSTSFTFGYSCTVHSSAGSEWDNVVLIDDIRDPELYDRWIYTGLTRAAQRITILGRSS